MRVFPFTIDNAKGDILVRWTCTKVKQNCFLVSGFFHNLISWSFRFVNKIRIEDIKLYKA